MAVLEGRGLHGNPLAIVAFAGRRYCFRVAVHRLQMCARAWIADVSGCLIPVVFFFIFLFWGCRSGLVGLVFLLLCPRNKRCLILEIFFRCFRCYCIFLTYVNSYLRDLKKKKFI